MIAVSQDGQSIFVALEDESGLPIVVKTTVSDLTVWETVYAPGAGTAVNVAAGEADTMYFYGNFGTDVGFMVHTISTGGNVDRSPTGLGSNVINALYVNPNDPLQVWAGISGAQDLVKSTSGGIIWSTVNAGLGINPTGIVYIPTGKLVICGNTGSQTRVLYSTDGGASFSDISSTGVHGAANVAAIVVVLLDGAIVQ